MNDSLPTGLPVAVLLDVGGVLIAPQEPAILDALRLGGVTVADDATVADAHYHAVRALDLAEGDVPDGEHVPYYAAGLVAGLGVAPEVRAAAAGLVEGLWGGPALFTQALPDGVEGLAAIRAAGCRIGIISNSDGTAEQVLAELAICQVGPGPGVEVDVIIDSFVVGVAKPDPAIFGFALRAMDVDATGCVYIGDTVRYDVIGARLAGIEPIHLDPFGWCTLDDHRHLNRLADLVALQP